MRQLESALSLAEAGQSLASTELARRETTVIDLISFRDRLELLAAGDAGADGERADSPTGSIASALQGAAADSPSAPPSARSRSGSVPSIRSTRAGSASSIVALRSPVAAAPPAAAAATPAATGPSPEGLARFARHFDYDDELDEDDDDRRPLALGTEEIEMQDRLLGDLGEAAARQAHLGRSIATELESQTVLLDDIDEALERANQGARRNTGRLERFLQRGGCNRNLLILSLLLAAIGLLGLIAFILQVVPRNVDAPLPTVAL